MSAFFTVDIISDQCFFLLCNVLSQSTFFTFYISSGLCFFDIWPQSTFFILNVLYQSAFFPFNFLSHSAFFLWTFCQSTFFTVGIFLLRCFVGESVNTPRSSQYSARQWTWTLMHIEVKVSLYCYDCNSEMVLLCVQLLWLLLGVVALPIDDGLQPPREGLHEVHQGLCWVTVQL